MPKKLFILDTNVLLSDPKCINSFQENDILLPMIVLEELDKHKSRQDEVGVNARAIVRRLEDLRRKGSLHKGVKLPGKGKGVLRIGSVSKLAIQALPFEFSADKADNVILATAMMLSKKPIKKVLPSEGTQVVVKPPKYTQVVLITRDVNLRLKCDSLGIPTEDYKNSKVTDEARGIYSGATELGISNAQYHAFCKGAPANEVLKESNVKVFPHQFIKFSLADKENDGVVKDLETVRYLEGSKPFARCGYSKAFGLSMRNQEQEYAMQLLLDPSVSLVTLTGNAGSGKTLIAVAAAFDQVLEKKEYDRIIISRSAQPMGKDIGFLPGTLQEKMQPWVAPVLDSIAFLSNGNKKRKEVTKDNSGRERERDRTDQITTGDPYIDLLFKNKIISVEALTYIRGRSIPRTIMLIDETQNLSVHELKTIVTRMGVGSKLILTGDLDQIDNTQVDQYSNGLTYAIEKFKECPFAGHVHLLKGERSPLATYASKVL